MTPTQLLHRVQHRPNQPFSIINAFALAVILAFSPVLTSSLLYAQPAGDAASPVAVNINTADAQTLASQLTGIGLSRAQAIVRYRETYGPFETIEELEDVKGIGKSTISKNRTLLTLK